jgi:hypothetical protein
MAFRLPLTNRQPFCLHDRKRHDQDGYRLMHEPK